MDETELSANELDGFDEKILRVLAHNGRITVTQLAETIGLSKSPCQVRLKRLESEGYILGYRAVLNAQKLDRAHIAFVEVKLKDTREPALQAFNLAAHNVGEIEECHMIAGSFDYLLKVRTKHISEYRRVLGETISGLPHVAHTSTHVAMESVKDRGV
ncbi:MAG: Lrp/AsnC ligand binding domain-containing protein [Alphaproteobacteria bacterium]|nr:Lrp/AsnC ligand binding domain-containing protein [Alphaproteobacteria bacterium]